MIELKPLKKIMSEYKKILEKYENKLETLTTMDCKKLIGEIRLFWYRNQMYVDYLISHITFDDEVAFLAGAVQLDIINNGHFDYILSGKVRLINDPIYKMSHFYKGVQGEIDYIYVNSYLNECIHDMLLMLRNYSDDFYIIPIEGINNTEEDEYYSCLIDASDKIFLSMFSSPPCSIKDFLCKNATYEDIENNLLPHINNQLVFADLDDIKLSLRDKCNKYLRINGNKMPFLNRLSESQLFHIMVTQYCMQAIAIVFAMITYHIIPFIRNDISFQYFSLIFHSNFVDEFSEQDFLLTYVPYIIQKAFNLSNYEYQYVRECMGNGKMIHSIIESLEDKKSILPNEIVRYAKAFLNRL